MPRYLALILLSSQETCLSARGGHVLNAVGKALIGLSAINTSRCALIGLGGGARAHLSVVSSSILAVVQQAQRKTAYALMNLPKPACPLTAGITTRVARVRSQYP